MRAMLSLYALDRPALVAFSNELRSLLLADDREGLGRVLELSPSLSERLLKSSRAVDCFLRPDSDEQVSPLFASLRRIAKKRALVLAWKSSAASLEGRLRAYDMLREDKVMAGLIDKLLDPNRLPWFLIRSGCACGFLDHEKRGTLAREMFAIRAALPPELSEFAEALRDMDGPVVLHDGL